MSAATASQWPQPPGGAHDYSAYYQQNGYAQHTTPASAPESTQATEAPPPPPPLADPAAPGIDSAYLPPPPATPPAAPGAQPGQTEAENQAAWAAYYQHMQQTDPAGYAALYHQQQQAAYYPAYAAQPQQPTWQGYGAQPQAAWNGYAAAAAQTPQQQYPSQYSAPATGVPGPSPPAGPPPTAAAKPSPAVAAAAQTAASPPPPWRAQQKAAAVSTSTNISYNAVAPPSALAPSGSAAQQRHAPGIAKPFAIQPQMGKRKALAPAHNAFASTAAPAYVKVNPSPAAAKAASNGKYPPAMCAYVERVFAQPVPAERKPAVHTELKAIIEAASAKGELWSKDWDTAPLPAACSAAGGSQAAAAAKAAAAAAAAAISAKVAQDSRWDVARRGADAKLTGSGGVGARRSKVELPDWRPSNEWSKPNKRQKKANKYQRRSSSESSDDERRPARSAADSAKASRRAARFGDGRAEGTAGGQRVGGRAGPSRKDLFLAAAADGIAEEVDYDAFIIKGTCQGLEKSYFRLTSAPDPSVVRPEPVLRAALQRLLRMLRDGSANYFYAADQFKGMRQDCTVQHLRTDLTVLIYEAHARAALQYGDHAEYNQCQTQLNTLFAEGLPGSRAEFLAYRLLYQTVHAAQGEAVALASALKLAVKEGANEPAVVHAMKVREAVGTEDWAAFFKLYASAPNMGRALMDMAAPSMRWAALNALVKALKPSAAVPFIARLLGFAVRQPSSPAAPDAKSPSSQPGKEGLAQERPSRASQSGSGAGIVAEGLVSGTTKSVAGTSEKLQGSDAALEVLPGSSQAVYSGKFRCEEDLEDACATCIEWLEAHGAIVTHTPGAPASAAELDCKASTGQLSIPEDTAAVAHGDQNLAIDDFLSKVVMS